MAFWCELGNGQRLYLENQGEQTIATIATHSPGQQQQSSSSVMTGAWTASPEAFRTGSGAIVKLATLRGEVFVQVQGTTVSFLPEAPSASNAQQMQLHSVEHAPKPHLEPMPPMPPMQPMSPMQPMPPMRMGDMEMNLNPMSMRMGNMELQMDAPTATTSARRFCTQCGSAIAPADRFCANCGHKQS